MSQYTVLDAFNDPDLFGPVFEGASWDTWRAFLAALYGLPMTEAQLTTYRLHTGRQAPPTQQFEEAALICGRRAGKSITMAMLAVCMAILRDYRPYLKPGEIGRVVILANDREQSQVILGYVRGFFETIPALVAEHAEITADLIDLPDRQVQIGIKTASMSGLRGPTYIAAICDEIAFFKSDRSVNPDAEILNAIRPGMGTIPGSMLLLASSPYAKRGELYAAFRDDYGRDESDVLVWKASTREMHPTISEAKERRAYERDASKASAEWGGNFRDDIAAFVSRETVEGVVVRGRGELLPVHGIRYVAFTDPSGGSADSMTLAIAHLVADIAVLDAVREVKPKFSPEGTVADFCVLLKSYGITKVTGDAYGGEWPREQFRKHGVSYERSELYKSDIYRDCLPLLNSGKLELLDKPDLVSQFAGLERRTARSGKDTIDHGQGGHDDIVNAVAGALLLAATVRARIIVSDEALALSRSRWGSRAGNSYPSGGSMRPSAFPR